MKNKFLIVSIGFVTIFLLIAVGLGLGIVLNGNEDDKIGNEIEDNNNTDFRLPLSIIPFHYKLEISPILEEVPLGYEKFTAPGHVQISVQCYNVTRIIILHVNNLTIYENSVTVTLKETGIPLNISSFVYNSSKDFFEIHLEKVLEIGKIFDIFIPFLALIPEDRLNGMYLDYYDDPETGKKNYVSTTLFAPYHARKSFPCFDEPNFRATFDITIGRHRKYHAMSNGQLVNTIPKPNLEDWYWDTFETTPSISTYIIAIIVSNFDYVEAPIGSFRNVSVRTYGAPYQISRGGGRYAVNLAADLLSYFEKFFLVDYPLQKAYSVALPHFFFNAMENWGLITYKEPVILYFPNETTEAERYKINYVTSHELAHQWFGNLINCKWWAYVWLKEGFATFYAHYGMNHAHPELEPWIEFPLTVVQVAMDFDITEKTHPLENFPLTSAAVADIYTRIPYEKGASILRMTSKFLTEDIFHTGIRRYVSLFQYKGAEQNDMFQALQDILPSNIIPTPLKNILNTWTTQSGFPILRVSAPGPNYLKISQEKFIGDDPSYSNDSWWVPITTWPKINPKLDIDYPDAWIPQNVSQILLNISTEQLVIVNPRSIGYYRVLYDTNLTEKIHHQLQVKHLDIPITARSQILCDYFNLAYAKYIPIETALNLTKYFHNEIEWVVWKSALTNIKKLYNIFIGTENFENFKGYWLIKMQAALDLNGGWLEIVSNIDDFVPTRFQVELMEWFTLLEYSTLTSYAQDMVGKWKNNPDQNPIPVDLQASIYSSAILSDSDDDGQIWNYFYQKFLIEKSSVMKIRFGKSLTCTKNSKIISRLLNMTRQENIEIHEGDKLIILNYIAQNPYATSMSFEFIKENFINLKTSLKSTKPIIDAIETMSNFMKTTQELENLKMFMDAQRLIMKSGMNTLEIALKKVKTNIEWMKTYFKQANSWFKSQQLNNPSFTNI